jgi:hypothetical protein
MAIEVLGTGQPDGTALVKAATEKLSMYGATAVVQAATITDAVGLTATSAETFTATDDVAYVALNSVILKLNTLLSDLEDLGVIAAA